MRCPSLKLEFLLELKKVRDGGGGPGHSFEAAKRTHIYHLKTGTANSRTEGALANANLLPVELKGAGPE